MDEFTENTPGFKKPKGRKKLDVGYDSDSEVEISDADSVSSANKSEDKPEADDDDMFASDNEEQTQKKDGFDMEQFEKEQELQDYELSRPSESARDQLSEPKEEVELEAFNLREEAESGTFDKDMNYVPTKNSDDEKDEDAWMNDLNAKDIEKARAAKEAQEKKRSGPEERKSTETLLTALISYLEPAESPMEALGRLRPKKGKKNSKSSSEDEQKRKTAVFDITDCCEQLINYKGVASAYDMSREEFLRLFKTETGNDYQIRGTKRSADALEDDESPEDNSEEVNDQLQSDANEYGPAIWEFRWVGDTAVHGPYSTYEMKHWKETYFEDNVEVRTAGTTDFRHVSNYDFIE